MTEAENTAHKDRDVAAKQGAFWQQYEPVLRELAGKGLSDKQIFQSGEIPVRTVMQITAARFRYCIAGGEAARGVHSALRLVSETPERSVLASEDEAAEPIEDLWDRALKQTGRQVRRALAEGLAVVQIVTDKPVAISISADWHVSTTGSIDLRGLRDYAQAIQSTPGAFALCAGDCADNAIKWEKDLSSVPDGWRLVGDLFGTFGLKMLGVVSGNHDDWSKAFAGIDALRWLSERGRIHFAPDELFWIVELIDPRSRQRTARYGIAMRHQFYRHSNLNPSHACFRWLEDRIGQLPVLEDGGELVPDIIAIGHNHVAVCEERTYENRTVWGCRMGPWQITSPHGRRGGWRRSPPTSPTFLLYPGRARPVAGHADYERALEDLARERAEWAQEAA